MKTKVFTSAIISHRTSQLAVAKHTFLQNADSRFIIIMGIILIFEQLWIFNFYNGYVIFRCWVYET